MDDALVLVRIGLAAVFAIAGIGKLLDRPGSRRALAGFKVPDPLARPLVFALPGAELATAVALLFAPTARWGAVASLVLLSAFVIGITRALGRGEAPDCHCFGQVHSEPASWATVARNVALAVPAALVLVRGPGPSLVAWVDGHSGQALALFATSSVAAGATLSAVVLWRENRRLRVPPPAYTPPTPIRIGEQAPRFVLASVAGPSLALADLLSDDRPCLITFVAPGCGPCATLLPEIAHWQDVFADRLTMPVVSTGSVAEAEALAGDLGLTYLLADDTASVSREFAVPGFPCGILIAADGTVGSAPAPGQVAIEALLRKASQTSARPTLVVHQVP